jgi:hypothetical protein
MTASASRPQTPAIEPEWPRSSGPVRNELRCWIVITARRDLLPVARLAAATKARILSGSFSPRARSIPEDTSTPGARVMRRASATLSTSSPPESMNGAAVAILRSKCQSNLRPRPPGRDASRGARASNISRSAWCS